VKYNAYGEIVNKGLNGLDQEHFEYDQAGRLIKTNKDDGVNRAYLYDPNGNQTAVIQSAVEDTDLKPLTINQIAALAPTVVQVTQSEYDARNQLIKTYQAPIEFTASAFDPTHVWVDGLNNSFVGGTITPAVGGPVNLIVVEQELQKAADAMRQREEYLANLKALQADGHGRAYDCRAT
jgi:YD repeat-containing protein